MRWYDRAAMFASLVIVVGTTYAIVRAFMPFAGDTGPPPEVDHTPGRHRRPASMPHATLIQPAPQRSYGFVVDESVLVVL